MGCCKLALFIIGIGSFEWTEKFLDDILTTQLIQKPFYTIDVYKGLNFVPAPRGIPIPRMVIAVKYGLRDVDKDVAVRIRQTFTLDLSHLNRISYLEC